MALTTAELREMLEEILVANNSGAKPPGPGGAPAAGGDAGIVSTFIKNLGAVTTGLGNLAGTFTRVIEAGIKLEVAWSTASQKIGDEAKGAMATLAKYGAGPLANLGNAAIDQSKQSQGNSNIGIGGGGFMDMTIRLREAGLTLEDYKTAMNNSKGALNNFGANANQRAEQLTDVGAKMQEAAMSSKQWSQLSAQVPKEEMAKIMLLSQMGRTEELATEKAKKDAAGSALALADQINRVAASSGKNRDVIEKELEARLSSAEVQAQLAGASEEQRKAIIASQAAISGMGKGAGDAAQVIQAGGRMSQENQVQLMSMGPKAMGEFIKGNQMMAQAKTDDQRRAAQEQLDRAKVDTAEYQKTKGFQRLLQSAPDNLRSGLRKSYEENLERGGVNAAQKQAAPGQSAADVERERMNGVKNLTQGKLESGAPNPQAAPQQRMTELNNAAFRAAGDGLGLLNREVVKLSGSKPAIEAWGTAIDKVYGKGGDVERSFNEILKVGKELTGATKPGDKSVDSTKPTTPIPKAAPRSEAAPTPATTTPLPKAIPRKAAGGPIAPDDVYVVGENGPELFKSKTAGDIVPNDKFQSMFGDIKTKISSLSGSPNAEIPKAPPKFEMPKFDMPKFDMPKFDISKFGGTSRESEEAKKKKIGEESLKERALDPSIKELRDRMSQINASNGPKAEPPKLDIPAATPSKKINPETGEEYTPVGAPKVANTKPAESMPSAVGTVTIKDLNDSLNRLNSSMDKMLKATLDISNHSEKTAKNSGKATGNRTHA